MKKFGIGILVITMIAVGIGIYWTQGEKSGSVYAAKSSYSDSDLQLMARAINGLSLIHI